MEAVWKLSLALVVLQVVASSPAQQKRNFVSSLDQPRYGPEIYHQPDERDGKMLTEWVTSQKKGNPEEQGHYFEGDIVIPRPQLRNGVVLNSLKWEDGKVPYVIKGSFSQAQKNLIGDAIKLFHKNTCLEFIPRDSEEDYLAFDNQQSGCWSFVGKAGGEQAINFQTPRCIAKVGTVIHEMLHAVGFYHEQNRSDRDEFVKVNFENIPRSKYGNFVKMSESKISSYGVPYDIKSVLHYSAYAFSTSGKMTIEAIGSKSSNMQMGQRRGFSKGDIMKINKMYCEKE